MEVWKYICNLFPNLGTLITDGLERVIPHWAAYLVMAIIDITVILLIVLLVVMAFTYVERRGLGWFQVRYGPNRVGPQGLFQPVADALKLLIKEDIIPTASDKLMHFLAPVVTFLPVLLIFAVVPFQKGAILADLNVGILYVVAIGTVSGIGVFMAGWGSNNKYALLAAMREISQMLSYEVPVALSIIGVIMVSQSLSMVQIVEAQKVPFILLQPLGFIVFVLGLAAQINRSPMDQVEAESELVAGFHTEFSGMKFALFYLAEYGSALTGSAIIVTLFLSGWKGPLLPPYIWFIIKVFGVFFVFVWMRATLPRVRIDQVMYFGWKFLLPLSLLNIFITGIEVLIWPEFPWFLLFINVVIAGILLLLWSMIFRLRGGVPVEVQQ